MSETLMETNGYNTRILIFPDGTKRYHYFSKMYYRAGEEEKKEKQSFRKMQKELLESDWVAFAERYGIPVDKKLRPIFQGQVINWNDGEESSTIKRKENDNMKRAVQKVYDIARSNPFTHFITLTFDPDKVDRYSYDACADAISKFTDIMRKHGCMWLLVPEQHKDGAYHFHGLITEGSLQFKLAVNPRTDTVICDEAGRPIFNITNYVYGHTTAEMIDDPARTASYVAKYMTKEITVPKGRNRYWASRSCARPTESLAVMDSEELTERICDSRFIKVINNEWGDFLIAETENR